MKNRVVFGKCRAYSNEGAGIVNSEGLTIFVNGLILDEEADIELTWSNDKIAYGNVIKLHKISSDRISLLCPVGTSCGGCNFQALSYEKEVEFKQNKIIEAFYRIAHMDVTISKFTPASKQTFYRNKIQVPFGLNNFGKITYGFFKSFSHEIVPFKKCFIENEKTNSIIQTIRDVMVQEIIPPYNESRGTGFVRHVVIRNSVDEKDIMVIVVTAKQDFKHKDFLFRKIQRAHPEITSLVQNINSQKTNVILGQRNIVIYGNDYIEDNLLGIRLRISSKSFYQINHCQCETLYEQAFEMANFEGNDVILDAYCGVGSIGLCLAKKVKKIVGVEIVPEAVENAKINAKLNGIENAEFIAGDVETLFKVNKQTFDGVIVDPPRKGLSNSFKHYLLDTEPQKILYVSCDPVTLARDVKDLEEKFELVQLRGVDLFPRTHHVESIAVLHLKKERVKNEK